ncbi:MAG: helix-turn-helix transcriptional regulator [Cyanobacteriota bacterium]|jgi:DNA-binding NarL/FixJ family response regulator|nr:helix-turn-helix transcriptional regulator [Cyanobacteriota bacterium]
MATVTPSRPLAPLTPAELRVLAVLQRGATNRVIAAELVISPRTVEDHVSNLLAKTASRNRGELLLWAIGAR